MNQLDEFKNTLDAVLIEQAKNAAQLQTITEGLLQLSEYLLTPEASKNFEANYYHSVMQKTHDVLRSLGPALYTPEKADFALFEFQTFVKMKLKSLES